LKTKGGLKLSDRASILAGGERGPAIVPGKPEESLLISAVRYLDEPKMPPKQRLTDREIEKLERWVAAGAPWPVVLGNEAGTAGDAWRTTEAQRRWWAFQPVRVERPPLLASESPSTNEIDGFVQAELAKRGMEPAPAADRRTWIRRATFDLTGLPPTPEETDVFVRDDSPTAYERVVDRLLAAPS
jgi:hypothetical protein